MPYAVVYLTPVFFLVAIFLLYKRRVKLVTGICILGLMWKIIAALGMTYLVINKYNFGDLETYYVLARDIALGNGAKYSSYLWGSYIPALLNSFIFLFMPPSIYGLAVVAGLSSFIYSYLLLKSFNTFLTRKGYWYALLFLMFLPGISMQSGFIGKETYILPSLGLIFYLFSLKKKRYLLMISAIVLITLIRPYQGAIIVGSMLVAFLFTTSTKNMPFALMLSATFFLAFVALAGKNILLLVEQVYQYGFQKFLSQTYHGGNLVLTPPRQPLTMIQNFRPFPWEAHNVLAVGQSLENLVVFVFFVSILRFLSSLHKKRLKRCLDKTQICFLFFVSCYTFITMFLFSYSDNIGDLSRRHVYYYPMIILMGCCSLCYRRLCIHHFHKISSFGVVCNSVKKMNQPIKIIT